MLPRLVVAVVVLPLVPNTCHAGVITACMVGAFPAAVAIFPQTGTIAASALEPEFQKSSVKKFFYNKGI